MKRDLFNGKVKKGYISYLWLSDLIYALIGNGCGALMVRGAFEHEPGSADRIGLLWFSLFPFACGILYPILCIIAARSYPKYPRLRKLCYNSDVYFVGSDKSDYRGTRRGRGCHDAIVAAVEREDPSPKRRGSKKFRRCKTLALLSVVLMFAAVLSAVFLMEHMTLLPPRLQSENFIGVTMLVLEGLFLVSGMTFAFRVKKLRREEGLN